MASRVILLGVGGLSLDQLDPLIHRGWLPNLEYLMGRGVVGTLTSDLPPFASAEWATLLTGEHPGVTGFAEGWRKTPGSYFPEEANLRSLAQRAPKSLLAMTGHETVLVGLPLPAVPGPRPPEDGIQVLHWQADRFSIRSLPLPVKGQDENFVVIGDRGPKEILEGAIRGMVALSVSISRMLRERGPQMVAVHFAGLDRIFSRFYLDLTTAFLGRVGRGLEDLLRQFFRVFDDVIGMVLDFSRDSGDFIVLASAHGYVPGRRVFNLNAFLLSRGYLRIRENNEGDNLIREVAAPVLRSMKIDRRRVKGILGKHGFSEVVDRAGSLLSSEIGHFEWNKTCAFSLTRTGIILNLREVEPSGTVAPGPDTRILGEKIRRELLDLEDSATGKRPIHEVSWREDCYEGIGLPELPHLLVRKWDSEYLLDDWRNIEPSAPIFSDSTERTGAPRSSGFYCFSGARIPNSLRSLRSQSIPEISKTIIELIEND